jgi:hypothetical protein
MTRNWQYALYISISLLLLVTARNITICTINMKGGYLPFEYSRSGPAADIAREQIKEKYSDVFNVTYIYRDAGTICTENGFGAIAAEVYYTNDVDVFIGPG